MRRRFFQSRAPFLIPSHTPHFLLSQADGVLRLGPTGASWKKTGGGRSIEVDVKGKKKRGAQAHSHRFFFDHPARRAPPPSLISSPPPPPDLAAVLWTTTSRGGHLTLTRIWQRALGLPDSPDPDTNHPVEETHAVHP